MKLRLDTDGAMFTLKCFLSAMLAAYISLSIGLPRPYWGMITAYIVSQPQSGAVRSKAVFRVIGTALGGVATVILVPNLANAPELLSLALALWVGFCVYVSLLDRTPRSYVLLLAGYTAAIIGFPSVSEPGNIFMIAALRVQEITIGILSAALIHGVLLPKSVTSGLLARVESFVADAERWSARALEGEASEALDKERRRLASDITDLHLMSTHLPFDTARLLPRVRTVRALQDRLSMLLPVASAVEDRLHLLLRDHALPEPDAALLADVRAWLSSGAAPEAAEPLCARAAALEPVGSEAPGELLRLSMLARLAEMIRLHRQVRLLRDQLRSPDRRAVNPDVEPLLSDRARRPLHRDHGAAFRSGVAAAGGILLCCTIWIGTAWPEGSVAAMMVAVFCSLFAGLDDPTPAIRGFFLYTLMSLPLSAFYMFWVLPHVSGFAVLAIALAPPLLLFGRLIANPSTLLAGLAMALGLLGSIGLGERYSADFASFLNGSLAQLCGVAIAFFATRLLRTVGADWSAKRLIRAGWADVVAMVDRRADNVGAWTGRMLDRLGLLTPRLGALANSDPQAVRDMLVDLRVGLASAELSSLSHGIAAERAVKLRDALEVVRGHYLALLDEQVIGEDHEGLARIDAAIAASGSIAEPAARRACLIALTGIRRNLYPAAPPPQNWEA